MTLPIDGELSSKPLQEASIFLNKDSRFLSIVAAFSLAWELVCLSTATQEGVVRPKLASLCQIPEALLWRREAPPLDVRRPYQSARLQKRKPLAVPK